MVDLLDVKFVIEFVHGLILKEFVVVLNVWRKIMKVIWKCPKCKREHWAEKNLVMNVCYVCQVEMEREVEDEI